MHQQLAARHLREYKPTIELNRKDKFIDIGIALTPHLIGIEIEITPAHIKENLTKDFSVAQIDFLYVCSLNKKVKTKADEILSELSDEIKSATRVCLISEFLNTKPSDLIAGAGVTDL